MSSAIVPGPLAPHLTRVMTPDEVFADYLGAIRAHIDRHPRSLQVRLGPSELGDPCLRKLGYKLLQVPEREAPPNWKATIGTASHAWAETAFDADNLERMTALEGGERWLIESKLTVGYALGYGLVTGHSDLYDRVSGFNLDHKFIGKTMLRKYRKEGPSTVYKAQAHLYGQGWVFAGYPIDRVAICFLPRDGELSDAFMWSEPYDPAAAKWALDRLGGIYTTVQTLGNAALSVLTPAESYCSHCPWLRLRSEDLTQGCPGVPGAVDTSNQLAGLLP